MARILLQLQVGSHLLDRGFSYVSSALCGHRFNTRILQGFQSRSVPVAHVPWTEVRNYRVKNDKSHMPLEQQFILRLLQKYGLHHVTDRQLRTFTERFNHLVEIGFRRYELVEVPSILFIDTAEIDARVKKLGKASYIKRISLPMLKFSHSYKSNSEVKKDIRTYLKPLRGYMSRNDEVFEAFNCSDMKMMEIVNRNPRLIGEQYRVDLAQKVRCLIEHGALYEDLYRNTNMLNNKLLSTIKSRIERLKEVSWPPPLPVTLLGRDDSAFENVVSAMVEQRKLIAERDVVKAAEVTEQLPPMSSDRLKYVRPRIEYLLSEGYSVADVVGCPQILGKSLNRIQSAVRELKPYHLKRVDLFNLCHYAAYRCLPVRQLTRQFQQVFAGALGCSVSDIPPLPKDCSVSARRCDAESSVNANASFLRDQLGFTAEELASVALVLAHSPDVVQRHWDALNDKVGVDAAVGCQLTKASFHRHHDNRVLLLNLLQYSIEKEMNFSRSYALHDSDESDDNVVTVLSSETAVGDEECDDDVDDHHRNDNDDDVVEDEYDNDNDDLSFGTDSDADSV